ncbi:DUF1722 domain-containing protein [bacterium]|nr:MAG: DUF1722 domain-containing protein [bacterium]
MTDHRHIRIAVSSCLLGENVRYDGDHRRDDWITDTLARQVTLVPVCPEVEVGMTVPRETVQLAGDPQAPRMVATESGTDWTAPMNRYAGKRVRKLESDNICGYIFKARSPSCGLARVKVVGAGGREQHSGRGLFAAAFATRLPLVPVQDDEQLSDATRRESFLAGVFAWGRLQEVFAEDWRRIALRSFHQREIEFVRSHSPHHGHELDHLVTAIADYTPAAFRDEYRTLFMAGLGVDDPAT